MESLSLTREKCGRSCLFIDKAWLALTMRKCTHWWLSPWAEKYRSRKISAKIMSECWSQDGYRTNMTPYFYGLVWRNVGKQGRSSVENVLVNVWSSTHLDEKASFFFPNTPFQLCYYDCLFSVTLLLDFQPQDRQELFSIFLSSSLQCKGSMALYLKCLSIPPLSFYWSAFTTLIWVWMQKQTPTGCALSSVVPALFVCISPIIFIKWCLALVGFVFLYVLHPHWIINRCQAMFALCSIFPQHLALYLVQ